MKSVTAIDLEAIPRVFHEPNRFSILVALLADGRGVTFSDLKESCGLTDGNLSRHLTALAEEGVVRIDKRFVDKKPRTTVYMTKGGVDRFRTYLNTLGDLVTATRKLLSTSARKAKAGRA